MADAPKAFVIGHPIAHSRSPLIHRHWLAERGAPGSYEAVDVAPDDLAAWLDALDPAEWRGGNVTVPHKEHVRAWLGESVDDDARAIGAVNTLWHDGVRWVGGCTDGTGFIANLDEGAPGWREGAVERGALVIGAGGAARAIVHALAGLGIAVTVANRTVARAEALVEEFGLNGACGLGGVADAVRGTGLVVNASSLGMSGVRPGAALPAGAVADQVEAPHLDPAVLSLAHTPPPPATAPAGRAANRRTPAAGRAVVGRMPAPDAVGSDIVYAPLRTPFLAAAEAAGLRTVDGLGMLLHQAVPGHARWFGVRPEVTPGLRAAVEATL